MSTTRPTTSPTVGVETLADALANSRRRQVLQRCERHAVTRKSDLAEAIAAVENDLPRERLDSQQRKRVYIALHQCHLPKLREWGLLDRHNRLTEAGVAVADVLAALGEMPAFDAGEGGAEA